MFSLHLKEFKETACVCACVCACMYVNGADTEMSRLAKVQGTAAGHTDTLSPCLSSLQVTDAGHSAVVLELMSSSLSKC